MNTTLEQIKSHSPCESSWKKLLKGLNKTKADAEPLTFRCIYNILDEDDLLWSTRVLDKRTRVHVGALFADTVSHLTTDKRVHDCIATCFKYSRGKATDDELKNAAVAAYVTTYAYDAAAADAADVAIAATYAAATYTYGATTANDTYGADRKEHKEKLARIFLTYIEGV